MALLIVFSMSYRWLEATFKREVDRNYRYVPFDMLDATALCNDRMRSQLGDTLLRSYVDDHSSRLDNRKGVYRIYMKADVGETHNFHEVDIYCQIDKWNYDLAYYKEIDSSRKLLSTDLKFFTR